ncbi:MAG: hypothetical protein R3Y67_08400 [Eubacteriales bacterium]
MDQTPTNSFINTSMIMGIIALVSSFLLGWTLFIPYIIGSLAIVFAVLSKEYSSKMNQRATAGFICGIASLIITTCIFFIAMVALVAVIADSNMDMALLWEEFITELSNEYNSYYY